MKRYSEIWDRDIRYATGLKIWRAKAQEIHLVSESIIASDPIARGIWHFSVVRMLRAFALENYAKGLILYKYPAEFIQDRTLRFGNKGHDLVFLVRRAGLQMTKLQEKVLALYSVSGEWRGRYPIPLSVNKVLDERPSFSNPQRRLKRIADGAYPITFNDALHTGITALEDEVYQEYRSRFERAYKRRLTRSSQRTVRC